MLRRSLEPLLVVLGCVLGTAVVWVLAFQSVRAARLDSTVLRGFTGLRDSPLERPAAVAVTLADPLPFAAMALAILGVALVRDRPRHAIVVAVVMAGAYLTTQLLKHVASITRPAQAPPGASAVDQWPSGHTTAALSLALCLVLVAPARWRPWAAAAGGLFGVAEGYGVLVLGWHYPSDVVAAFGVATAWLALGVAVLRATSTRMETGSRRLAPTFVPTAVAALIGALLAAATALVDPMGAVDYVQRHTAFVAAAAAIGLAGLALAALTAAALTLLEHRASATDAARRR